MTLTKIHRVNSKYLTPGLQLTLGDIRENDKATELLNGVVSQPFTEVGSLGLHYLYSTLAATYWYHHFTKTGFLAFQRQGVLQAVPFSLGDCVHEYEEQGNPARSYSRLVCVRCGQVVEDDSSD